MPCFDGHGQEAAMKIGFIGGGNMGEAIIAGVYKDHEICLCEQDRKKARRLKRQYNACICDITCVGQQCDAVVLAVKPQHMEEAARDLAGSISAKTLVISIAAGITTQWLEKKLPVKTRVIRAMPNMPAQIGEGITALCKGNNASRKDLTAARRLFEAVGQVIIIEEKMIDAVTAVSGSGPAYVFYFTECLMNAAGSLGFSRKDARELVYQTLRGSVHQLFLTGEDASSLRQKVTSKGGTTEAAVNVFKKAGMEKIFKKALSAARTRSRELSR